MLHQVRRKVTLGILACGCTVSMGCPHTYAAYCSGHLTEGDVGSMMLLVFLLMFRI